MAICVETQKEFMKRMKREFPDVGQLPLCTCGKNQWTDAQLHMYTPYWFTYVCGSCGRHAVLMNPPANCFFISAGREWFLQAQMDYMNAALDGDQISYPKTPVFRPRSLGQLAQLVLNGKTHTWDLVPKAA